MNLNQALQILRDGKKTYEAFVVVEDAVQALSNAKSLMASMKKESAELESTLKTRKADLKRFEKQEVKRLEELADGISVALEKFESAEAAHKTKLKVFVRQEQEAHDRMIKARREGDTEQVRIDGDISKLREARAELRRIGA